MTQRHTPWKHYTKKTVALLLSFCLLISSLVIPAVAEDAATYINGDVTRTVDTAKYIVLDLSRGSITISTNTYSGYQATVTDGVLTWESRSNASWTAGAKFYILQAPNKKSVSVNGTVLTLLSEDIRNDLFIDQNDVLQAYNDWTSAAAACTTPRTATTNYIDVSGGNGSYDITIDDIWSTNQYADGTSGNGQYTGGGLRVSISSSQTSKKVTLNLCGDNKLANLYYACEGDYANAGLTVQNASAVTSTYGFTPSVAADDPRVGSLVVIGNPESSTKVAGASYYTQSARNNWNSVIGSVDTGSGNSYNLDFTSGVVYAGAHHNENCTAIGGGGNGMGEVSISGTAIVTAVASTTGTAIGGGIAHTSTGGLGIIKISGGKVYAYNYGITSYERITTGNFGSYGNKKYTKEEIPFVYGTAIGGGARCSALVIPVQ